MQRGDQGTEGDKTNREVRSQLCAELTHSFFQEFKDTHIQSILYFQNIARTRLGRAADACVKTHDTLQAARTYISGRVIIFSILFLDSP